MSTNVRKIQPPSGFQTIKKPCFLYTFKAKNGDKKTNIEQGTSNIESRSKKVVLGAFFTS